MREGYLLKNAILIIAISISYNSTVAVALVTNEPCPLVKTTALNPETGNKSIFSTPCDVPSSWSVIYIEDSTDDLVDKAKKIYGSLWDESEAHRAKVWSWGLGISKSVEMVVNEGIYRANAQINELSNEKIIEESKSFIQSTWDTIKSIFSE